MAEDMKYTLVQGDEELYIKELLQRRFHLSSRLMRKMKVGGGVFLNGKAARLKERGRAGDVLSVSFPDEQSYFEPENIPLVVVHEDDDLLVVNKQPGLVVHPTKNYQTGTLANAIAYYISSTGQSFKLRFVNRLDQYTSGLIIVAKNSHCQDFLMHRMEENRVVKRYIAIVHGIVEQDEGTIDLPIDKDPNHVARRIVIETGYPSVTHYKVLERIDGHPPFGAIEGYTLLELKLDTGRTHQIRVHLTHMGHPIVGDELYGQLFGYDTVPDYMPRQALHAAHLEFPQPVTGNTIIADAPMPRDMELCLERIKQR